jgi:hypothetical protein
MASSWQSSSGAHALQGSGEWVSAVCSAVQYVCYAEVGEDSWKRLIKVSSSRQQLAVSIRGTHTAG